MYRILTENMSADRIKCILMTAGVDYTIFSCEGTWHGRPECSIIIELANVPQVVAESIAQIIKYMNCQEAVLVQAFPMLSTLI